MSEYRGIRLNTRFKVICNGAGAKMARCFNVIAGFCNCFRLAGQNIHVEHLFKKLNVCLSILLRPQWVSHKELLPIEDWKLRCSLALLSTFLWRQLMHYFCPESKVVHTLQNSANWCTISGKATYNHHCSFLVLCRALVIFQVTVMSRLFQSKSVLMALAKNQIPCSKQKRLWKLKNEIRNSAFDKFAFFIKHSLSQPNKIFRDQPHQTINAICLLEPSGQCEPSCSPTNLSSEANDQRQCHRWGYAADKTFFLFRKDDFGSCTFIHWTNTKAVW